jgi:hypothetical protein
MTTTDKYVADLINRLEILEKKYEKLETEIAALTVDRNRFLDAMRGAAEMALNNNVALAMMPKHMKEVLKEYVKNGKTNEATKTGI